MKKHLILFSTIIVIVLSFVGCEPFIENKITINNNSDSDIELVVASKSYSIPSGTSKVLSDFDKGTFAYQTIYSIPVGITAASAEGDVSGDLTLLAGTELLLVYTSFYDGETYTLYGTLSSSDDVNSGDPFAE